MMFSFKLPGASLLVLLVAANAQATPDGCPAGMRLVRGGAFMMGSAADDRMKGFDELSLDEVDVGPFCIDTFEYPNKQGATPTVDVGFEQSIAMCEAQGKRLCSEAEWEKACKGPRNAKWPYGESFDPDLCNNEDGAGDARTLSRSGQFSRCRSGFSVSDLSGNAAEWTAQRSIKGGSFASGDYAVRCAARKKGAPPFSKSSEVGFRCCAAETLEAREREARLRVQARRQEEERRREEVMLEREARRREEAEREEEAQHENDARRREAAARLEEEGRQKVARAREAAQREAEDAEAFFKGQAALDHGDCKAAVTAFESAVGPLREDLRWLKSVAQANDCAGNEAAALGYWRRVSLKKPDDVTVRRTIGDLSYRLDKKVEAKAKAEREERARAEAAELERAQREEKAARVAEERRTRCIDRCDDVEREDRERSDETYRSCVGGDVFQRTSCSSDQFSRNVELEAENRKCRRRCQ